MIKAVLLVCDSIVNTQEAQLLAECLQAQNITAVTSPPSNLQFAKNTAEHYAELVARVSLEPDETLFISKAPDKLALASQLGIATYLLGATATPSAQQFGTWDDLMAFVQQPNWQTSFAPITLTPALVLIELRGNIGALMGLIKETTPSMWYKHPIPNEWSILQILCHLFSAETQTQRTRLVRIVNETNPFIADPSQPPLNLPICGDDAHEVAQMWASEREKTLHWLATQSPDAWERPARHSIFGLTRFVEMAHFTAQHDRLHITQLCQTIGKCSDD